MWLILVIGLMIGPVAARQNVICGESSGNPFDIPFVEQNDPEQNAEQFNTQIMAYLNTTGSSEGLQAAIEAPAGVDAPAIAAEVIKADFTADNRPDVLVNITTSYGATFGQYLSLFTCSANEYILLDTVLSGDWDGSADGRPTTVLFTTDMNNNQRREVVIRSQVIMGTKGGERIDILEWDGDSLIVVTALGPDLGAFNNPRLANFDDDPATLELILGNHYGYGEEIANAVIEISHWRAIDEVYSWDGKTYVQVCRYFTDMPLTYFEILHNAETLRACWDYDAALTYYEWLWNGSSGDTDLAAWTDIDWLYGGGSSWILSPENVTDEMAYQRDLERDYLRAFAGYRLMQLDLNKGDLASAERWVNQLLIDYTPGKHGHIYTAMAAALWETYQQSGQMDTACAAAETAFQTARESGDDPGIEYYEDTFGDQIIHYGFYFYSGFRYSPDPDNLFAVPEDIDGILDIPICF